MKAILMMIGSIYMAVSVVEAVVTITAMKDKDFQNETRWRLRALESMVMAGLFFMWSWHW